MSKTYINKALRALVIKRARNQCEYCQTQAFYTAMPMEVDYIIPVAMQGATIKDNLCLARPYCNNSKNDRVTGLDAITSKLVALYNPRTELWNEHFVWSNNGEEIIGLTDVGRATVELLKLNRSELVDSRKIWVKAGWHPPKNEQQNEQK